MTAEFASVHPLDDMVIVASEPAHAMSKLREVGVEVKVATRLAVPAVASVEAVAD